MGALQHLGTSGLVGRGRQIPGNEFEAKPEVGQAVRMALAEAAEGGRERAAASARLEATGAR